MYKSILQCTFLLLASCLVSSCTFKPNFQERGTDFIQGVWEEEPSTLKDSLIQYTRHQFKFTCDSVYIKLETSAKANYYSDSCFNNGKWKEYAKGNYVISKDTLFIIATFTNARFKQKLSGCYRIGQYLPSFIIKSREKNQMELQGLQQHVPVLLQLREPIKCVPQPL